MSRTTAAKLLIKPGGSLWMSDPDRLALVGALPEDVAVVATLAEATVALAIVDDAAAVHAFLDAHAADLATPAVLWFVYPKGGRSDINRDTLWPIVATRGLRPITQIAVDDTWSALRFRPLAADEAPLDPGR